VPPSGGKARIAAFQRLDDRHRIHDHQPLDRLRMVECGTKGDVGAAVVADDREALMAEPTHQRHHVGSHRTLRIGRVVGNRGRLGRSAIAAQVGTDHGVMRREQRRHAVPGDVRAGMAVQQQHRRAGAAMAHAQRDIAERDLLELETFEQHAVCGSRRRALGQRSAFSMNTLSGSSA
jgi:hypothetical protein